MNSGSFVGPISDIYQIVTRTVIENEDDDQLYYTTIFLNPEFQVSYTPIFISIQVFAISILMQFQRDERPSCLTAKPLGS